LVSIIEHRGSHSSGHYTAYRKVVSPDARKAEWFFISDEHVVPVKVEDVLGKAQAYMLYYERKDKRAE
jgi:ubiquitin C-terminal hydrolase